MGRPAQLISPGESRVIALAVQGLTDKEICRELGVQMTTVRTHWVRVRRKMDVVNRAQVIARATELGQMNHVKAMERRELALHAAANAAGIGIWEIDADGKVTLDKVARRHFGVSAKDETLHLSCFLRVFAPQDQERLRKWIAEPVEPERTLLHKVGSISGRKLLKTTCSELVGAEEERIVICVTSEIQPERQPETFEYNSFAAARA